MVGDAAEPVEPCMRVVVRLVFANAVRKHCRLRRDLGIDRSHIPSKFPLLVADAISTISLTRIVVGERL